MLVHVAVALLGLTAVSAIAVDYGLFFVGRGQAQNSADAGALAAAVALAYDDADDFSNTGPAKRSARMVAEQNLIAAEAPVIDLPTDVTFPPCPDDGTNTCVRVDVHRNAARGNPLPTFFGNLFGRLSQDTRATAVAKASASNASSCMKPWIIPDMWEEHHPSVGPWTLESTFETEDRRGRPLANPDQYRPPTDPNPTGFRRSGTPNHIGLEVILKHPQPSQQGGGGAVQPGWMYPVRLNENEGGGNVYRNDIMYCSGEVIRIGDMLRTETGSMIGPTRQGVDALLAADPSARWVDPDGPGGVAGQIVNSCMNTASCSGPHAPSPTISPRVAVVPVFNTATFSFTSGPEYLQVVNILGFFLQQRQGNEIRGVLIPYQGLIAAGGGQVDQDHVFSWNVTLIR
jgi:hypothetical protein